MKTNLRLLAVFFAASVVHAFAFGGSGSTETTSYDSVKTSELCIAFAFEDGPSSMLTPQVLKILADHNAKATFFVTGENALSHPDMVKQEFAAGHEIGSRSWAHSLFSHQSDQELMGDLQRADQAIKTVTGSSPSLYSPADLSFNSTQCDTVNKQFGYTMIFWSVDALADKSKGAAGIANTMITQAKPGAIIMTSDLDSASVQALPSVLDSLAAKGYKFVTVSDLIAGTGSASRKTRTTRVSSSTTPSTTSRTTSSTTPSRSTTSPSSTTAAPTATPTNYHPFGTAAPGFDN